jgi:hypothetical protein
MITLKRESRRHAGNELDRVIEPLASYICATDRPKAALLSALAALISEVEHTTQSALAHVATYSEGH